MQTSRLEINADMRERAKHALRHYERFLRLVLRKGQGNNIISLCLVAILKIRLTFSGVLCGKL